MSLTTSIDDLPPEIICELFKRLRLWDLAACSMVNKRWHSIHSSFKVHRLVAFGKCRYDYLPGKWVHSDRQMEENELCPLKMFGRLTNKPDGLLSNLKHLALCNSSIRLDLNKLNAFSQLVHLEIDMSCLVKEVHLNLPKLKLLAFHWTNPGLPLSIDCPELGVLVYSEYESVILLDVKHPEAIRCLETNMFGEKLAPFRGVDCLMTREFQVIDKDTLRLLPELKELHYIDYSKINTVDRQMKRTLREFVNDVKTLGRSDFQFRFLGFQLTKTNVNEIDFGVQEADGYLNIYMKNWQLIQPEVTLDFIYFVIYTHMIDCVAQGVPAGFFHKFTGIQKVMTEGALQNEKHFLLFLKSLISLKSLDLGSPRLSPEFFKQLPASAKSLIKLELQNCECHELNFEFISYFSCLSWLGVYEHLSIQSVTSLVRSFCTFEMGSCWFQKVNGKRFTVKKVRGSNLWMVSYELKKSKGGTYETLHLLETENPEVIVSFFGRTD